MFYFQLSTIILKGNHKCIIILKSESKIGPSQDFSIIFTEIVVKFSFFNNSGSHN